MKKIFLGLLASLSIGTTIAQTIFSYGPNQVSKAEFTKVYDKNNTAQQGTRTLQELNDYLKLYALFKMKVADAERQQLDTTAAVRDELYNYKKQLSQSFLVDPEVSEKLLAEAYERSGEELNVSHILIMAPMSNDTAAAYKKMADIAKLAATGDFAKLAEQYSEDRSTAKDGGNIGYMTALETPYEFETMAYATPKGTVSPIFRTNYGYHILKVLDRRPNSGMRQVSQILVEPAVNTPEEFAKAKVRADEMMAELKAGKSWNEVEKKYNNDAFSKDKNGLLAPFGRGKVDKTIEDAAFALKRPGDHSPLLKSDFGYHVLQLEQIIISPPLDSVRATMLQKIENDSRIAVAQQEYSRKVKKQFNYNVNAASLSEVVTAVGALDTAKFALNKFSTLKKPLITVDGMTRTQADFLGFVSDITNNEIMGKKDQAIKDLFNMYEQRQLEEMQVKQLEQTNTKYQSMMKEYRDGVLLFDMMDKNVWSKASGDEKGLEKYFEDHRKDYTYKQGFEGYILRGQTPEVINMVLEQVKKGKSYEAARDTINLYNESGKQTFLDKGKYEFAMLENSIDATTKLNPSKIYPGKVGDYIVYIQEQPMPAGTLKNLDETRGFVVKDYQEYLEQKWNDELLARYPLKINEAVVKTMVK